jgi:hypothetical protein
MSKDRKSNPEDVWLPTKDRQEPEPCTNWV